jgi:hypothetical protein
MDSLLSTVLTIEPHGNSLMADTVSLGLEMRPLFLQQDSRNWRPHIMVPRPPKYEVKDDIEHNNSGLSSHVFQRRVMRESQRDQRSAL